MHYFHHTLSFDMSEIQSIYDCEKKWRDLLSLGSCFCKPQESTVFLPIFARMRALYRQKELIPAAALGLLHASFLIENQTRALD